MRRTAALLLTLSLLLGCLTPVALAAEEGDAAEQPLQVVYIPLDDRPFHTDRMKLMAESLGIELIMPDTSLYDTTLDGQGSAYGQSGDRGGLLRWLKRQAGKYDTFILSLDQLLSGGLMNSRCMEKLESVYLAGEGSLTEYQIIDYLAELSQEKEVYLIDTVLRLACSSNFGGYTSQDYQVTRAYGKLPRFVLGGTALTVDNIIRYYGSTGGISSINEELLRKYLAVRERKLRLSDYAVRQLAGQEHVHYLLGVDDSSGGNNVQSNEIAYFEQYMGERDLIFSAVDGLGQAALAKIYLLAHPMDTIRVSMDYFGSDPENIGEYNFLSTETMLEQEIPYYGGQIVTEDPEVSVLVVSAPEDPTERGSVFLNVVDRINQNERDRIPTILIDLSEQYQKEFYNILTEETHLGTLLSYSGYYEQPVQVTMALSQGMARYQSLWTELDQEAHTSHLENLLSAFVKQVYKVGDVRGELSQYWTEQKLNSENFGRLWSGKKNALENNLTTQLQQAAEPLTENFKASNVILSLPDGRLGNITEAKLGKCRYPWLRAFEIGCQVSCAYGETPYPDRFVPAYVSGMGDGRFAPGAPLTRNQAAKLLTAVSGLSPSQDQSCQFPDVPAWAAGYVQCAFERGYVKGYENGLFRGDNTMTRAEFASMLVQYLDAENLELSPVREIDFSDLPRDSEAWYTENVYLLADGGLISGYEDGSFQPGGSVTRAEAVKLLSALFRRDENIPDWVLAGPRFTDVPESHWAYEVIQEASALRVKWEE